MFNLKVFAGLSATFIVLLYLTVSESEEFAQYNSILSKQEPVVEISPLERIFNDFEDLLKTQTKDYLESWAKFDASICPHKSEYFSGVMDWYLRTATWHIKDWWRNVIDSYFSQVLMNQYPGIGEQWYRATIKKQIPMIRNRLGINLEFANQKINFEKHSRPPIDTPSIDPRKITIVSGSDANSTKGGLSMVLEAIEQRKEYANYFGNKFKFYNLTQWRADRTLEHPVWLKLALIEQTFNSDPDCEWIWWLDSDAIIMNGNLNITRDILSPAALDQIYLRNAPVFEEGDQFDRLLITPSEFRYEDIDFIVSQDLYGINLGSFLIHRSQFTQELLQIWGDPLQMTSARGGRTHDRREQDAFTRLYTDLHYFRQRTAIVGPTLLNSYVFNCSTRYISGDTLVHFAGRSEAPGLANEWDTMIKHRIRPGELGRDDDGWGTYKAYIAV